MQLRFALQCQSTGDAMRREAEIRHWRRDKKRQLVGLWPMDEHGHVRSLASFSQIGSGKTPRGL